MTINRSEYTKVYSVNGEKKVLGEKAPKLYVTLWQNKRSNGSLNKNKANVYRAYVIANPVLFQEGILGDDFNNAKFLCSVKVIIFHGLAFRRTESNNKGTGYGFLNSNSEARANLYGNDVFIATVCTRKNC